MIVSLLVSFHNHEKLVRRVVESVLNQDCGDYEAVFIDDASTDGSFRILQETLAEHAKEIHCKVKCLRNERNLGMVGTFNRMFEESSGDICVMQCGDDLAAPNRVSSIIECWSEAMVKHPNLVAVVSRCNLVDEGFRMVRPFKRKAGDASWIVRTGEQVYDGHLSLHGAALSYSRKLYEDFGPLDPKAKFEDEIMWFRAVLSGDLLIIREALLDYRCAGGASTRFRTSIADTERIAVRQERTYLQMLKDLETRRGDLPNEVVARYEADLKQSLRWQRLLVGLLTRRGAERRRVVRDLLHVVRSDASFRPLLVFALPRSLAAFAVFIRGTFGNLRRGTRLKRLVSVLERE